MFCVRHHGMMSEVVWILQPIPFSLWAWLVYTLHLHQRGEVSSEVSLPVRSSTFLCILFVCYFQWGVWFFGIWFKMIKIFRIPKWCWHVLPLNKSSSLKVNSLSSNFDFWFVFQFHTLQFFLFFFTKFTDEDFLIRILFFLCSIQSHTPCVFASKGKEPGIFFSLLILFSFCHSIDH